jgi:hypothetical protein
VFENRVLRNVVWSKREETNTECGASGSMLFYSINIFRVIKLRRMVWRDHIARMGENFNAGSVWLESLKERKHFEDLAVDGSIILKWILKIF